jgi:hypothetical protein
MYCSRAALHPELFSSSDPHASPSRNVAVTELRALWLGVMDRFAAAFSQQIDLERAEGYAPPGVPSRELATALIWASERCLYIAGLGVTDDLPDEERTVRALQALWRGGVYQCAPPNPATVRLPPDAR